MIRTPDSGDIGRWYYSSHGSWTRWWKGSSAHAILDHLLAAARTAPVGVPKNLQVEFYLVGLARDDFALSGHDCRLITDFVDFHGLGLDWDAVGHIDPRGGGGGDSRRLCLPRRALQIWL